MSKSFGIYQKRIKGNPLLSFLLKYKIVESGCWEWQGSITKKGYGQLNLGNRKVTTAHRFSYTNYIGETNGLFVCHSCDNRKCVNPFHLFLGTNTENMQDASKKGRLIKAGHPSQTSYNNGCRCDVCREIHNSKGRIWKRNKRAKSKSTGDNTTVNVNTHTSDVPPATS